MREDRSNTEHDAGVYARANSLDYDVDPDTDGVLESPTGEFDLARFVRETQAIYQTSWYKKNIT